MNASMRMIAAVTTFLEENAGKLTPEQEQVAAVFILEYPGQRAIGIFKLIDMFKLVGIRIYYGQSGGTKLWKVRFSG